MFKIIIAHSEKIDVDLALLDLIVQCKNQLFGMRPGAAILFSALQLDCQKLLNGIEQVWPQLPLIGCTTDGEISSSRGFCEDSVSLTLFVSDVVTFSTGLGRKLSNDIKGACQEAIHEAGYHSGRGTKLCITTPESLTSSGQQMLEALTLELGDDVPVLGGVAGDYWQFVGTKQFYGTEVISDALPILLFSGPLLLSYSVDSGWKPIGQPGIVTRSSGNLVHEIDNKSAIEYYRRFIGKNALPTGDRPLALLDDKGNVLGLRAPLGTVDEHGGVTYFADIPENSKVQLTIADRDSIIEGSRSSLRKAIDEYPKGYIPEAGLFFSCAGRKFILGSRVKEEYSIIQEELPSGTPFIGFYAYGEISPLQTGSKHSLFHNETFVSLLLGSTDSSNVSTTLESINPPQEAKPDKRQSNLSDPIKTENTELKQHIRILETQLNRAQNHRLLLEQMKDQTDSLYQNVIKELEETNLVVLQSIQYASRIQHSILPLEHNMDHLIPNRFIIWEPRDVVGGDMYWYRPWGDGHIVMLGDCTGHGVPGAFMTLIVNGALEMALMEVRTGNTAALLQRTHQLIQKTLDQDTEGGSSDDGIEMGICYIPPDKKQMIFSGAGFPLFIIENEEVSMIKGDRKGMGYRGTPKDVTYSNHEVEIKGDRIFYMTSDGMIDQIGGEKRRGFGKKRFKRLLLTLNSMPVNQQGNAIFKYLKEYQGQENRRDDVAVIGFKI